MTIEKKLRTGQLHTFTGQPAKRLTAQQIRHIEKKQEAIDRCLNCKARKCKGVCREFGKYD